MHEDELKAALSRVALRAQPEPDALDRIKAGRHRRDVRRRTMTATSAVAAVTALAFGAVQLMGNVADSPQTFATGGAPTDGAVDPTADDLDARWIAALHDGEVTVFDAKAEEPGWTFGWEPERSATAVHLSADGYLYVVVGGVEGESTLYRRPISPDPCPAADPGELACRPPPATFEEVGRFAGQTVAAIAWSPDGIGSLAALTRSPDGEGGLTLRAYPNVASVRSGGRVIWEFPAHLGRGVGGDDDVHVEFSPNGERLLVVNTFVDAAEERQDETLLVFDVDGTRVGAPVHGTHARWTRAGTILYKPLSPADDDTWRELRPDTGEVRELPLSLPGATSPMLSPDGRQLAVEDDAQNSVVILDLETGETETMPGAAPLWLDPDTLLVTEQEPCENASDADIYCGGYIDTGRVLKIAVGEQDGTVYPIATTRGAAVLYGEDVAEGAPLELLPAEPGS